MSNDVCEWLVESHVMYVYIYAYAQIDGQVCQRVDKQKIHYWIDRCFLFIVIWSIFIRTRHVRCTKNELIDVEVQLHRLVTVQQWFVFNFTYSSSLAPFECIQHIDMDMCFMKICSNCHSMKPVALYSIIMILTSNIDEWVLYAVTLDILSFAETGCKLKAMTCDDKDERDA
jgi:hypothetical protein